MTGAHPYGVDSKQRAVIYLILGVLSIFCAIVLSEILSHFELPWIMRMVDLPSVWGFYWIWIMLFDKFIWKWGVLAKLSIVKIPNLNGQWAGELTSSHNGIQKHATLTIRQTWQQISIVLETDTSRSCSLMADIREDKFGKIVLSFEYHSETLPNAIQSMNDHNGFNIFEISPELDKLEGEYFTCWKRKTCGTMLFYRKQSEVELHDKPAASCYTLEAE